MTPVIQNFEKGKYIEKIINSCENQQQVKSCEKWIEQINIEDEYKDHFYLMLEAKSITLNNE